LAGYLVTMGQVQDTYRRLLPLLPRFLSSAALERVGRIAARVPDAARSHNLEIRLNSSSQIDFLTYCGSRQVVPELEELLGPSPSPLWKHNLQLLREWAREGTPLSDAPFLSLEYDGGERFVETEPEPNLFVALDKRHFARHWEAPRGETRASRALGRLAFQRLLPDSEREACLAVIDRIYAALPPSAAILHAAVMTTREPCVAKPYVLMPREGVKGFLKDIEWPGSTAALDELLETYYKAFPKTVYLDLTVTDRVHQRLGLVTCQFQRQEADFSNLDWWRLPPELEPLKAELEAWTGLTEESVAGETLWLRRWVETKAVLHETSVEYKAYLGFGLTRPPLFG
jgi:hypothetical protein